MPKELGLPELAEQEIVYRGGRQSEAERLLGESLEGYFAQAAFG